MECQFAAIYFCISLVSLAIIEVLKFCDNLLSQKYLLREYPKNKSLAKLNRFTVHVTGRALLVMNFSSVIFGYSQCAVK